MSNKYDPSLIRAWSAGFGSASCSAPELEPQQRPLESPGSVYFSQHNGGKSYQHVFDLVEEAETLLRSRRPATSGASRRPATSGERRPRPKPIEYNDPAAFANGMPGYTGFRPRVRQPYTKSASALDLASQNSRAYVSPATLPKFKRHGQPKDGLTEFRKTCLAAIGKGTPYLKDPNEPNLQPVSTKMQAGEYFVEVLKLHGNRPTRGRFDAR